MGRWTRFLCAATAVLAVLAGLAAAPGFAVVVPQDDPLREHELRHPDLWYENVFRRVAELPVGVSRTLGSELSRLGVDPANAFFDLRTGRWGTLIVTRPLIPGPGVGNDLRWPSGAPQGEALEQAVAEAFRTYLAEHVAELRIDLQELGAPSVTVINDRLIQIHVGRVIDGIPVRDTFVKAAVNSGNLVLYGERNWGPVEVNSTPQVTSGEAEGIVRGHLEGIPYARLHEQPHLELVPVSDQPEEAATLLGSGLEYRLAWVLRPYFADHIGSWEALVDAHSGELLAFVDTNHYASRRVEGWIYPVSNDEEGPDGTLQPGFPMPFADLSLDGTDVGFTTTGGNAPTGADPGTIRTTLSGQYMRMNDSCGEIDESVDAGDLDLEGIVGGTDCAVPPGHSPGDTNSSRTGFYELNRLAEQARGYLPDNTWLDQQLTANMNLNQTCNAFWDGTSVNFFRSAIAQGCRNTGEIAAVFDHEWGHGMDDNDGNPSVSSPGEGIADIFAHNRLNTSCIGRGFRVDQNCGGYGDPCLDCTGVRDIDWEKRQSGQPHDIAWIDANCGGGSAPCGGSVHCEGAVYAEAVYDLVHRDFMGFDGSPWNLDLNTALEIGTRLSFHGSSNVGDWYQCTTDGTGGCNADGGYLGFLAADDDNGDITDGTPHMSAIFAAFDRHQISCNVPAVVDSGCAGGPTEAPANVVLDPFDEGVQVSWDAVAGATEYRVFRTEGVHGCDFGKVLVGETTETSFSETGLRNDFELFYSVVAVGASDACTSPMSACLSATPTIGPSGFIEGTVVDADSTAPIEGAVVEAAGDVTVSDVTDADGFYRVQVPVGTYDVTADAEDYDPQTVPGVEVLDGETVTLDFALSLTPRPIADISPDSFEFTLQDGEVGTDTLSIGNLGDLDLEWSITEDAPETATTPSALDHDPALDEPLAIPDFVIDSPANGGEPFVITVPAGLLTRGDVVGFSFIGTVSGINDTASWASDMCMLVEAPDGTTYGIGGFSGTESWCAVNDWDFQGGGSDDDGTYESFEDNTFPAVGDEGDWTFTFINDWDSTGASTMDWTDVTITLHKQPLPVCDDVTDVPWLSADPDAGTTAPGATEEVTVTADSTQAGVGTHEAALCVATNDPDAPVVPVLVSLTVVGDGDTPVIDVDPDSLSSNLEEGETETQPLTISNLGTVDLNWEVTETGATAGDGRPGLARASAPRAARRSAAAGRSFDAPRRAAIDVDGRHGLNLASLLGEPLPSLRVVNPQNGGVDCDGEPGIIIHDDGTVETGYTANPDTVTEVRFVDQFTPSAYPATFSSVCVAFITLGQTSLDFEVVVFDDDGTDGAPGTELGSLAVTADGIPNVPGAPVWFSYDISSLGITVAEGSVYIGVRYAPPAPGGETVFVAADESTGNPPGFAGGYWWESNSAVWAPIEVEFTEYRSLMVRAVEAPVGGGDCELPTWVSVSPTSGTVPGGGSQVADVTFDSTGLDLGTYEANLCLASNDPVNPLVMVPLTLTVEEGGGVPIADISPDSFTFEVPQGGSDSDTLNVGNIGDADLTWSIDEAEGTPALLEEWSDNFDGYATGSQLHGQGGWKGWLNDPAAGALVSDAQAQSAPNSAEIVGASDLVREYVDSTAGQWTYTAWQYVPTDFTGTSMFIMLNTYNDGGSGLNWSVQVEARGADEQVVNAGVSGGTLPLIRGEWVELRVEIDLDADTQEFFYGGELLYSGTWTGEVSGGGALNIGVVDLFANGATPVYYDDMSLTATGGPGPGGCAAPSDVPWLSATPDAGTTAPDGSEPVDVAVDASALDPGAYTAQLCVTTNDPAAPLVEVPVNLTVVGGDVPVIDVDPDSLESTLPAGDSEVQPLTIANIGGGTLDWEVTETGAFTGGGRRLVGNAVKQRLARAAAVAMGADSANAADLASQLGSPLPSLQVINPANGVVDCDGEPGIIIHDDGTVENGYSGNPASVGLVIFADEFTPSAYPATFSSVCVAYLTLSGGPSSYDVEIVVFDDDGADGSPGTELGALAGTVPDIPVFPNATPVWASFDISSLGIEVTEGSVYIGARWVPPSPVNVFIGSDESTTNPPGFAGGYWWNDNANMWAPTTSAFPNYRSLMVRAVEGAAGPADCTLPTWVSVDPTSGSLPGGESQVADVTFDTAGLDPGDYTANLCLASNDPATPLLVVPLSLTVTASGPPDIDVTPTSLDFQVPAGENETQVLNVGNLGGEDLTWNIDEAESALLPVIVPEGAPYAYDLAEMPEFNAPVGGSRAAPVTRSRGEAPADRVVLPAPQEMAIGDFTEGFDDITTLPGAGWAMINNSDPEGPSSWFQGNETIFPAHEGDPDAYIAANYESTADNGTISNWLLTPEVTIVNGTEMCFWTRKSELFEEFLDRLEVRMSVAGDSTDVGDTAESVGDFVTLLLTIEPDLELPNEYPEEWTEFCLTVRERSREPVTGRFAFRYWVTDSGPDGTNGDYIGIDTVSVTQGEPPPGDCDNPVDIPWLAVDPTSGTTAGGTSSPVDVTVSTGGLDPGDYAAQLCVTSNDADEPLVAVPVTLTVTEGPGIECGPDASPVTLYFSDLEVDEGGWTGTGEAPWEWGAPELGVFENCDTVPEDEPDGPFSGANVWATNLNGCYTNSGSESVVTQTFDLSALSGPVELSWWNWYEVFVSFDMAEVLINGDLLWEVTTTAATPDYVREVVDLSAYAGQSAVEVDFRLFATTVVNRSGWYLDDIKIEYCEPDSIATRGLE